MTESANVQPREGPEDCLGCKLIGSGTMFALSLYWNHMRMSAPKNAKVNRIFLGTMAVGLYGFKLRYTF